MNDQTIPPLDGEGPLWLQIRRAIAIAILDQRWPAGTQVPPEQRLTEHYATSRMTVHKAIRSLAAEGLVERRPKLGTIVTPRAGERPVFEIWDAADAVHRAGGHYGYSLIDAATLPAGAPGHGELGVADDAPVLRLLALHLADGRPFQLEERLVNVEAAPRIARQPLETVSPGQWLLAHVPWTEARHSITARGADGLVAGHLQLELGEACLVIERRTWNGTMPVTLGRFWYPGGDHSLEGRFRPSW